MPWIPLQSRPAKIKNLVAEAAKLPSFNLPPEDFYNEFDYGLMSDEQLSKKLLSVHGISRNRASITEIAECDEDLRENEASEVHSLRYLKEHAQTLADREWANLLHDELLIKLWMQYVEETGETFYPPLSDDLYEEYLLTSDDYHET